MNYEMTIKKYVDFVDSEQRPMIAHEMKSTEIEVLALSNALGGECGELQNVVKKLISKNQFFAVTNLNDKFVEEAGDTLWYLFRLINKAGFTVESVMAANIAKLNERYNGGDTWRK